jgi:CBS domain-containing protein
MSIGRICVREVETVEPNETVYLAARRMLQRAVGSLVVVSDANQPIGILTDRDLVERVLAKGRSPVDTLVQDVMSTGLKTITEDGAIESALALMRSGRFRRVPVVDDGGRLVGLISLDDVLMLRATEFTQIGRLLQQETPRCVVTG